MTYGFDNDEPLGEGQRTFVFELSRLVEERLTITVRGHDSTQAQAFLRDHEPDLEGKWETYDKAEFEVESSTAV